jgi:hypothetical protein
MPSYSTKTKALSDYVQDLKPFRTKLLSISENISFADSATVNASDRTPNNREATNHSPSNIAWTKTYIHNGVRTAFPVPTPSVLTTNTTPEPPVLVSCKNWISSTGPRPLFQEGVDYIIPSETFAINSTNIPTTAYYKTTSTPFGDIDIQCQTEGVLDIFTFSIENASTLKITSSSGNTATLTVGGPTSTTLSNHTISLSTSPSTFDDYSDFTVYPDTPFVRSSSLPAQTLTTFISYRPAYVVSISPATAASVPLDSLPLVFKAFPTRTVSAIELSVSGATRTAKVKANGITIGTQTFPIGDKTISVFGAPITIADPQSTYTIVFTIDASRVGSIDVHSSTTGWLSSTLPANAPITLVNSGGRRLAMFLKSAEPQTATSILFTGKAVRVAPAVSYGITPTSATTAIVFNSRTGAVLSARVGTECPDVLNPITLRTGFASVAHTAYPFFTTAAMSYDTQPYDTQPYDSDEAFYANAYAHSTRPLNLRQTTGSTAPHSHPQLSSGTIAYKLNTLNAYTTPSLTTQPTTYTISIPTTDGGTLVQELSTNSTIQDTQALIATLFMHNSAYSFAPNGSVLQSVDKEQLALKVIDSQRYQTAFCFQNSPPLVFKTTTPTITSPIPTEGVVRAERPVPPTFDFKILRTPPADARFNLESGPDWFRLVGKVNPLFSNTHYPQSPSSYEVRLLADSSILLATVVVGAGTESVLRMEAGLISLLTTGDKFVIETGANEWAEACVVRLVDNCVVVGYEGDVATAYSI